MDMIIRKLRKLAILLPVIVPFILLFYSGLWGIDFGWHWDEDRFFVMIENTIKTGNFTPDRYTKPSLTYWLSLSATIPHLIGALQQVGFERKIIIDHLLVVIKSKVFLFQIRQIFLFVSSFTVIWVYIAEIILKRTVVEALLAAALLGFSWELAYHARWMAQDAILMQFGALTLLLVISSVRSKSNIRWVFLVMGSIAAGLGMGTKYPGGLLILPVLIAFYINYGSRYDLSKTVLKAAGLLLIFVISYLISTPGTILQPTIFIADVTFEIYHYQTSHYGQTVGRGLPHLWLMFRYFAEVFFSHYRTLSVFLFLFVIPGAYALFKENRRETVLILSFPLAYILFFSVQRVMIVRNLLVVAPFLAILSARGIVAIWSWIKYKQLRVVLLTLVTLALAINAGWIIYSAGTIADRDTNRFIHEMANYIDKRPGTVYFVSDQVWEDLVMLDSNQRPNVIRSDFNQADMILLYASEGVETVFDWPRNKPGLATKIFGPWEVNFDYYPTWAGDDRILLLPIEKAKKIGVLLVQ
jgi:4-amino-4-deoxy-L-arabinose transferase-like glycosyltransferase